MGRLLKYAFILALAVGVGYYFVLGPFSLDDIVAPPADPNAALIPDEPNSPASPASIDEQLDYMVAKRLASLDGWRAFLAAHADGAYAQSARAEVARGLGATTTTPGAAPSNNGRVHGLSERLASLGSYARLATAKVQQFLLADEAPASGNPAVFAQAATGQRGASQSTHLVSPAAEDAPPATSAASRDAPPDASPADSAERSSPPPAPTGAAAGQQLAPLAPDESCQRDEARLAQLRSAPSLEEAARFANELGCAELRPQVLSLMESLAPTPSQDAATATPPGARVESEGSPASPPPPADVASSESAETCTRDEERLARLGSNPSGDEALRFVKELRCEKLLPQLQRLLHSPDFEASVPRAPADSTHLNPLLGQTCASERAALDEYLRAFVAKTGAELWTGRLPSAGIATPTSYLWQGRQYVVIGAGGYDGAGAPAGDTLVAFALPHPGEFGPSPWFGWLDRPGRRFRLHAGMAGEVAVALAALWLRRKP